MKTRRTLRANLTPLIDVVFILLLFFLLSTQLQHVQITALKISGASSNAATNEEPYLIEMGDVTRINGRALEGQSLAAALSDTQKLVAIRPSAQTSTQALLSLRDEIRALGFERLVIVQGGL